MSLQLIKSNWKLLGQYAPKSLTPAIDQIHRGVQFIAMTGKHYIPNEPDDSHTNMKWLSKEEVLAGNWIRDKKGNFRFAMRSKDLTLIIYNDKMESVSEFALDGKTNSEGLDWVKSQLTAFGKDASQMKMDIHYDIPPHETDNRVPYKFENPELFAEAAKYRANSHLVLEHFAKEFETASTVRTWPHHFDIGTYIPMVFNDVGGAKKSFSLGFAIADSVVDEPYFYITQWSANKDIDYSNVKPLSNGEWLPDTLGGATLKASSLLNVKTAEAQAEMLFQYFQEGTEASLKLIGVN